MAGGETVVITRNGTPMAELRPLAAGTFVPRSELALAAAPAPAIDRARFRDEVEGALHLTLLGD